MEDKGEVHHSSLRVRSTVSTLWAGQFVQSLSAMLVLISLPSIARDLNSSIFIIIWVIFGYALVRNSLGVPMSRLGDLYGRKLIFIIGFVIATAALVLSATATDAFQLIFFRMIQGLGGSMTIGLALALVVDVAPRSSRGRAIGIATSGYATGLIAGPLIGGLLLTVTSWRSLFGLTALLYLGVLIAAILLLPKIKLAAGKARRFDWQGGLTFSSALGTFLLGLSWAGNPSVAIELSMLMFAAAVIILIIFLLLERKKENPMLDLRLFKNSLFGGAVSVGVTVAMARRSMPLVMVFFLQGVLNLSPLETAAVLIVAPTVQLFNVFGGWLSDKIGSGIPMTLGITVYAMTFLTLYLRASSASIPELMLYMGFLGLGALLTNPPLISMALGSLDKGNLGVGSGILANFRDVGGLMGQAIAVAILGIVIGQNVGLRGAFGDADILSQSSAIVGIQWIFLVALIYCLLGLSFLAITMLKSRGIKSSPAQTNIRDPDTTE